MHFQTIFEHVVHFKNLNTHGDLVVPSMAKPGRVSQEVYDGYRAGRAIVAADVVSVCWFHGVARVVLIKRRMPPLAGEWWVHGGTFSCYSRLDTFLQWVFLRESGLFGDTVPSEEAFSRNPHGHQLASLYTVPCLTGLYRVAPSDELPDAFALVGLGIVHPTLATRVGYDNDHEGYLWVTAQDLRDSKLNPYVRHIALRGIHVYGQLYERECIQ